MGEFGDLDAHWLWLMAGLVLAIAEMLVPGTYLIWLAAAALLTGVLTWGYGFGLEVQIGTFAVSALVAVLAGRQYFRDHPILEADPLLNRRTRQLVGQSAVATAAFEGSAGRVRVGDSEWMARGVDAAAGERLRITGSEGSVLLVAREGEEGPAALSTTQD